MRASDLGESLSDISSENDDDLANREEDPATRASHIRDMVRKLDAILEVVFRYLRNVVEQDDASGLVEDAQREAHFNALMNIFQSKILKTFKSRYTQFLLFWFASVKRDYADIFLGVLVTKAWAVNSASEGASQPDTAHTGVDHDIIRCASASYVGSFVSRAAFIDAETTRHVVSIVCEYIDMHLSAVEQVSLSESGRPQRRAARGVLRAMSSTVPYILLPLERPRDSGGGG
jgi:RNA polymerase I-specific transcription initiation factor RRN3